MTVRFGHIMQIWCKYNAILRQRQLFFLIVYEICRFNDKNMQFFFSDGNVER